MALIRAQIGLHLIKGKIGGLVQSSGFEPGIISLEGKPQMLFYELREVLFCWANVLVPNILKFKSCNTYKVGKKWLSLLLLPRQTILWEEKR